MDRNEMKCELEDLSPIAKARYSPESGRKFLIPFLSQDICKKISSPEKLPAESSKKNRHVEELNPSNSAKPIPKADSAPKCTRVLRSQTRKAAAEKLKKEEKCPLIDPHASAKKIKDEAENKPTAPEDVKPAAKKMKDDAENKPTYPEDVKPAAQKMKDDAQNHLIGSEGINSATQKMDEAKDSSIAPKGGTVVLEPRSVCEPMESISVRGKTHVGARKTKRARLNIENIYDFKSKSAESAGEECNSSNDGRWDVRIRKPITKRRKLKEKLDRKPVETLVFLSQQSSYPYKARKEERKNNQVTEICMIAVSRKDYEQCEKGDLKGIRIVQKLCLPVKPRNGVHSDTSYATGLNNWNLGCQAVFDENAWECIRCFLSRLSKPACVLAHGGATFHFPLLKAELSRFQAKIPSGVFFVDTLKAFRQIKVPVKCNLSRSVQRTKNGNLSYSLENLYLYFFGTPADHQYRSEKVCLTLAEVGSQFSGLLNWIDNNYVMLDKINPMW